MLIVLWIMDKYSQHLLLSDWILWHCDAKSLERDCGALSFAGALV
jgi:hypothetical protein